MAEPVNQLGLADMLGVDPKTIRAWERQGCPIERKSRRRGDPTLYSVAAVSRWREAQAALAASGDLAAMDMEEARRRKLAAEAAIAELELEQKRGRVVEVEEAAQEFEHLLSSLRGRLLPIGSTVAPRLVLAQDAAAMLEIVDDAVIEALHEISGSPHDYLRPEGTESEVRGGPLGEDDASAEGEP
jgi:phage terminase Nu1 subunit (DNA packaging protein)